MGSQDRTEEESSMVEDPHPITPTPQPPPARPQPDTPPQPAGYIRVDLPFWAHYVFMPYFID